MELLSSVDSYFRETLTTAMRARHVAATEPTASYLVSVLADFVSAPPDPDPLALKLAAALSQGPSERAQSLKEIGDTSLYVSGFFAESLTRRLISVEYYEQLGRAAYGQLARMPRQASRGLRDVYEELAAQFARFVEVFGELRAHTTLACPHDVAALYERWRATGSDWLKAQLRACGVILLEPGTAS